jgi:hypothetical protein
VIPDPAQAAAIDDEFRRLHERVERERARAEETGDDYRYRKALSVARSWLVITVFGGESFAHAHERYWKDNVFHLQVDTVVQMLTSLDGPVPTRRPSAEELAELSKVGRLEVPPELDG